MLRRYALHLLVLAAIALPVALTSCESTVAPAGPTLDSTVIGGYDRAVLILNEGQYTHTNGSLDVVIYRSNGHDTVIDRGVIKGLAVGNAIRVIGRRAYVVDNSSNQLIVLGIDSLKKLGSRTFGLESPNDLISIGGGQALLTYLFTPKADIIDLASLETVSSIVLPEGSVSAAVLNNKAYITTSSYGAGSHVAVYDIAQQKVTKTIPLLRGAGPIAADSAHNRIVVGAVGVYDSTGGRIYWLDPATDELVDSVNTTSTHASLVFLSGGTKLFALDEGLLAKVDLTGHTIQPLGATRYYYNGAYDPVSDQLYVGTNDFSGNRGMFDVYGATDLKLHWSDTAGIAPAHFAFYH